MGAGYNTLQSSFGVSGRSFMGTRDMQHGGELVKDNMTGSSAVINANGSIGNASIKGLNAGMTASNLETRAHALSDVIQNSNLSQRALEVASGKGDSLALSENDRSAITNATQHALANAYSKATGVDVKQAYNDIISGKVGISFGVSGELSTNSQESEAWYQNLSKDQKKHFKNHLMKVFLMKLAKIEMQVLHLTIFLKQEMLQILLASKVLWIAIMKLKHLIIQWVMMVELLSFKAISMKITVA